MILLEPAPTLMDRAAERAQLSRWLALPPAALVGAIGAVLVAVFGVWWIGLLLGVIIGAGWFAWRERAARTAVIDALGGRPLDGDDFPRLANLVDGLAITTGEAVPSVRVLEDPAANLAVAGPSGGAVLVVTSGLLEALDRVELEAVLAQAFARIRANDALLAARAGALVAAPLLRVGPLRDGGPPWRFVGMQWRASMLRRLMGSQREFLSDLAAVDVTRYPPALATALDAMTRTGTAVGSATWGTAHCWLAPALPSGGEPSSGAESSGGSGSRSTERINAAFSFHEPTDHRIGLLSEL